MQFYIKGTSCFHVATGAFLTNKKGGYEGNFVGEMETTKEIADFLNRVDLLSIAAKLAESLEEQKIGFFYHGFLGVDMLLCRTNEGDLFLHPCSEINTRYNMGLVAHKLSSGIAPGSRGLFKILRQSKNPDNSISSLVRSNTAIWRENLLESGIVILNPSENREYVAILEAWKNPDAKYLLRFSDLQK